MDQRAVWQRAMDDHESNERCFEQLDRACKKGPTYGGEDRLHRVGHAALGGEGLSLSKMRDKLIHRWATSWQDSARSIGWLGARNVSGAVVESAAVPPHKRVVWRGPETLQDLPFGTPPDIGHG